jgi:predicted ATP-dependent Lon-type protease
MHWINISLLAHIWNRDSKSVRRIISRFYKIAASGSTQRRHQGISAISQWKCVRRIETTQTHWWYGILDTNFSYIDKETQKKWLITRGKGSSLIEEIH